MTVKSKESITPRLVFVFPIHFLVCVGRHIPLRFALSSLCLMGMFDLLYAVTVLGFVIK